MAQQTKMRMLLFLKFAIYLSYFKFILSSLLFHLLIKLFYINLNERVHTYTDSSPFFPSKPNNTFLLSDTVTYRKLQVTLKTINHQTLYFLVYIFKFDFFLLRFVFCVLCRMVFQDRLCNELGVLKSEKSFLYL